MAFEQPTGKAEQKKTVVSTPKEKSVRKAPVKQTAPKTESKDAKPAEKEVKKPAEDQKPKTPKQTKPVVKKKEVSVNATSVPFSTKQAIAICRFIRGKKITTAVKELVEVSEKKKAIPMKGEIPHKKSVKGIASGSGRYPVKAATNFIRLLKSLQANANMNEIENPVITTSIANFASRPYGRFGQTQKKRTHITLKAKAKKEAKK